MAWGRRKYSSRSSLSALPALIFLVLLAVVGFRGAIWYKDSLFGKFERFNLVLIASPLTLISVDTSNHSATEVRIPDDLYIPELAFGYGGYRATAVYSVGELDKRGGETTAKTISDFLGIPVDGYIFRSVKLPPDIKNFFLSPTNLLSVKSNLNLLDKVRFGLALFQTRFDKIKVEDLATFADSLILADGSTALSLDKEKIDSLLSGDFVEERIRDENLRVEVINSTTVVGLGNRAGRILASIGANVVSVGTTDVQITGCQIQATAKTRSSVTVSRISSVFSCQILPPIEEGRSEVIVTLGTEYAKMLGK